MRDSVCKIPLYRFLSGVTGVAETSNHFDLLGLLSDKDSSARFLQIDMDM